ncbi:hypothetical protein ACFYWY_22515 [Streptomyces sp. NPDC002870]|uniref:hypothetical protein n=1 Tax=Streptomyces sp. NPDC002870 TaxID=3364666 RepID=UPI00367735B2
MASTVLVVTALEDAAVNEREVPVVRVDPADIGPALTFAARIEAGTPTWGGQTAVPVRLVGDGFGDG